jgi:hypothetical protein
MSRLNAKRVMVLILSTAILIYFIHSGVSLYSSDAILGLGFVLMVWASLFWKRMYSHPAHGSILLCCSAGIIFVRSWYRDGLSNQHTVAVGVFFLIFLLLSIAMVSSRKSKEQ